MNPSVVRLFHMAAHAWLALYMLALLVLGEAAWTNAPVELFTKPGSTAWSLHHAVDAFTGAYGSWLCASLGVIAVVQLRRARWWLGLVAWALFRAITFRTWLASNGGIQLMENMLLWSALMAVPRRAEQVAVAAFWIARLQLLLVYAVTAAHKLTGSAWIDGSAVLRVAHDPLFHLGWLAHLPGLCRLLTHGALCWMALFAMAVWWRGSRRVFLALGAVFHGCTAIFMDIPQMGLAFIACYALWLQEGEARAVLQRFRRGNAVALQ